MLFYQIPFIAFFHIISFNNYALLAFIILISMEKSFTQEAFLMNPYPLAYLEVMGSNNDVSTFSTQCSISLTPLDFPVINLKCTPLCYMSLDNFIKQYKKHTNYKCKKCGENRDTTNVVYDIGYQTILARINYRRNNPAKEIYIGNDGTLHKQKKEKRNQILDAKISPFEMKKITQIRENPNKYDKCSIRMNLEDIKNDMKLYYQDFMTKLKIDKSFLFCRGKKAQRGGKQWFMTIYIHGKQPFHLAFYSNGKQIAINKDSEIHFIPSRQAFYILTNQGKKVRLLKGSVSKIVGNRLELQQVNLKSQINSTLFFGVAHSDQFLWMVGGMEQMKTLTRVIQINLDDYSISKLPPMKEERAAVKACFLQNKLYVIGGVKRSVTYNAIASHQCYDFNKQAWLPPFDATFKGFNMGVFASNNNQLVVYGGVQDANNQKFMNKYYLIKPSNFSIISSGRICEVDPKLDFTHESAGFNGQVLRTSEKFENQIYLFNFTKQGASVNTKFKLDI